MSQSQVVLLHGLGESSAVWKPVISRLQHVQVITPNLFTQDLMREGWTLPKATDHVAAALTEPAHVVGVSLGAIVGLNLAIRYPDKVSSLCLSAPQVKLPPRLMAFQRLLMRVLPVRIVCPPGIGKTELFTVFDSLADLDLRPYLSQIHLPTHIVCGSRDWANRKAARRIAGRIPQANCTIVAGMSHQWHSKHPDSFADMIETQLFYL